MEYLIPRSEDRQALEAPIQHYKGDMPDGRRKRLGQYFTSVPLSRLLATLALQETTRTVLDPMCGSGNLLEATALVARGQAISLKRLSGIELDPDPASCCGDRLNAIAANSPGLKVEVITGNAFNPKTVRALTEQAYDLVIANPPYVRYQTLTNSCERTDSPSALDVREGLVELAKGHGELWTNLATGYSGHADLSVPSWLLSAMLVAPGGTLALVIPATWRSRDYADIIRYLMARAFRVEVIVEDAQPGWFSDALVRTNLLVARRLVAVTHHLQGTKEGNEASYKLVTIAPEAASDCSVVGKTFEGADPEKEFANWLDRQSAAEIPGIRLRSIPVMREIEWLRSHATNRRWFARLEDRPSGTSPPLVRMTIPDPIPDLIHVDSSAVMALGDADGVSVGQGLRTGCNGFFYVDSLGSGGLPETELIEPRGLFPGRVFEVPRSVLRSVLRRQSEIRKFVSGRDLEGRVLDLRGWVLEEDSVLVDFRHLNRMKIMSNGLAKYVRAAGKYEFGPEDQKSGIASLSAVRTNVRPAKGDELPRYWYTLPDLAPRHVPQLFISRVNNLSPSIMVNRQEPLVVDANFSTIWTDGRQWTSEALFALLRSTWSVVCMEILGTRFGGGALKLEATQIRRLPTPRLSPTERNRLHELGVGGDLDDRRLREVDEIILQRLLAGANTAQARELLAVLHLSLQNQRRKAV